MCSNTPRVYLSTEHEVEHIDDGCDTSTKQNIPIHDVDDKKSKRPNISESKTSGVYLSELDGCIYTIHDEDTEQVANVKTDSKKQNKPQQNQALPN